MGLPWSRILLASWLLNSHASCVVAALSGCRSGRRLFARCCRRGDHRGPRLAAETLAQVFGCSPEDAPRIWRLGDGIHRSCCRVSFGADLNDRIIDLFLQEIDGQTDRGETRWNFRGLSSGQVAVGFMPAFKHNLEILLAVVERGHKAHGYVHSGTFCLLGAFFRRALSYGTTGRST